jgi:plastocyanin
MLRSLLLVSLLAFTVAACGNDTPATQPTPTPTPTPSPGTGSTVTIPIGAAGLTTTAYSPNPVTVAVGATVTWVNNDNIAHTATSTTRVFDTGLINPGASVSKTFSTAGSFPYLCSIHPGMVGTVNVQ